MTLELPRSQCIMSKIGHSATLGGAGSPCSGMSDPATATKSSAPMAGVSCRRANMRRLAKNTVRREENGSAVAEFVMVSGLLIVVFLGVLQLTLALHVRNTLLDAAASGARYGTLADRGPADGVARTQEIITGALNSSYAANVQGTSTTIGGRPGLVITVRAGIPLIGMIPLFGHFEVSGEAVRYG